MKTVAHDQLDPRAQRTRVKLIRAIQEIVRDRGIGALTHQAVAEQARVGRATVYRHFPTRQDFLWSILEVIDLHRAEATFGAQGSLEEQATGFLTWMAENFQDPLNRAFLHAILAQAPHDDTAAEIARYRMNEASAILSRLLHEALPDQFSEQEEHLDVLAMLVGPIWMQVIVMGRSIEQEFIRTVVQSVLRAIDARATF